MLTVRDAAARVGERTETILEWIRSGRLQARVVGGRYVIREEDLKQALSDEHPAFPVEWQRTSTGDPMPDWVRLIREERESH